MAEKWAGEIRELREANPLVEETPLYQQHYLGRWVVDDSKLVYRYLPGRNDAVELPRLGESGWSYVLGVDLGYEDATAFCVVAYHQHDKTLYVVHAEKHLGLDVTATAERIRRLASGYDLSRIVVDNANKQAVEEMKRRHGLPLHPADKTGKADFIELMNGDFIQGYVKLLPEAKPLASEYAELVWDDKSEKRQEHPNCANHCADAALYAWRYAYPYLAEARKAAPPKHGSAEWQELEAKRLAEEGERMKEEAIEQAMAQKAERDEWGVYE
jgi:hypothetical protein